MNKYLDQVKEFHDTFNVPVLQSPQLIGTERSALRISLIQEELNELKEAIDQNDLVEIADALCDLQYVLSGTILEFGLGEKFEKMFDAVHASNMSKACNTIEEAEQTIKHYNSKGVESYHVKIEGKYVVLRLEDDKVLKSINYTPASLAKFLKS